jgi:hypothetical protein
MDNCVLNQFLTTSNVHFKVSFPLAVKKNRGLFYLASAKCSKKLEYLDISGCLQVCKSFLSREYIFFSNFSNKFLFINFFLQPMEN